MKKTINFLLAILISFLLVGPALATGLGSAGGVAKIVAGKAEVTEGDISNIVGVGLNAALSLVGLIFLFLMVYAGYLWMTARGEEEMVKKAQKIIISSMIGLVIVLGAYAITVFVTMAFVEPK